MKRLVLAASLLALTGAAFAMPSDLPWEVYACKEGKGLKVKHLSDGMAIGIQVGGDETTDLTFIPEKEDQAGFKDGLYKAEDDAVLTLKNELISITGSKVEGAPYADCKATGEVIESN
ncbi:hypothetical protein sos41_02920 [Alphaproteobacteria bacterium SO-S41]|nr:hypothetical protein sos41_02920 [Alphaproteobacteria bacterium SO-S41]